MQSLSIGAWSFYQLNSFGSKPFFKSFVPSPTIWCDNQSAGHLAHNPVFHSRSKHTELDLHFIQEKVLHKELTICYIPSGDQLANVLTKYLSNSQFCSLGTKLAVFPRPVNLRGDDSQTTPYSYNNSNNPNRLSNHVTT